MAQHQYVHEGTAQELVPYLAQHPNVRFGLIELSREEEEMPTVEDPKDASENLQEAFADLIEAAKHVEREVPIPLTDSHEVAFSEALLEKYRKMGLHR